VTRSFPSQDEGLWKLGAHWGDGRAEFLVFAPFPYKMAVKNFNSRAVEVTFPSRKEAWKKAVDTSEER